MMSKTLVGKTAVGKFDIVSEHVQRGKEVIILNTYYSEGEGKVMVYQEDGQQHHSLMTYWEVINEPAYV